MPPHSFSASASPDRILLVDDDAGVREGMRRALSQAGLNVTEASNGDTAVVLLRNAPGLDMFDMLVTDIRMGGGQDGVALANNWRNHAPGRPVLFVSAGGGDRLDPCQLGPRDAMLAKPFRRARLVAIVRRMLAEP